eukprot:6492703-Amphidinium_carterae.1
MDYMVYIYLHDQYRMFSQFFIPFLSKQHGSIGFVKIILSGVFLRRLEQVPLLGQGVKRSCDTDLRMRLLLVSGFFRPVQLVISHEPAFVLWPETDGSGRHSIDSNNPHFRRCGFGYLGENVWLPLASGNLSSELNC